MVLLGLVLLIAATALTLAVVLPNGADVQAEAFNVSLDNVSVGGLFLVGVVTGIVGLLGLGLAIGGLTRRRRKRAAAKHEVEHAQTKAHSLAEENARLQQQLERERTTSPSGTPAGWHGDGTPGSQPYPSDASGERHGSDSEERSGSAPKHG
jgi:Mg2+/citrate symporter